MVSADTFARSGLVTALVGLMAIALFIPLDALGWPNAALITWYVGISLNFFGFIIVMFVLALN